MQILAANRLKLNADKTELDWTGSRHNLSLLGGCVPCLHIDDDVTKPSDHVRLLGVTTATDIGLDRHVSNVCRIFFIWLRQFVARWTLKILVYAFVTSRVDYCNSVLSSALKTSCGMFKMLQHVCSQGPGNTSVVCHG